FVSWLPADKVPAALFVLMPSRLLNFNTMLYVALVLGLIGAYRTALWSQILTIALVGGLLLSYRSMLWDGVPPSAGLLAYVRVNPLSVFELVSIGLIAAGGFRAWKTRTIRVTTIPLAVTIARAASLAALAVAVVLTWRLFEPVDFRDRTNDRFFATIAAEPDG